MKLMIIAFKTSSRYFRLACLALAALASPHLHAQDADAASEADSFEDEFHAQVWLTDMSRRLARQVRDPEERIKILRHVHYEAIRADLAPELVLAVIDVESNFDRFAISVAVARSSTAAPAARCAATCAVRAATKRGVCRGRRASPACVLCPIDSSSASTDW